MEHVPDRHAGREGQRLAERRARRGQRDDGELLAAGSADRRARSDRAAASRQSDRVQEHLHQKAELRRPMGDKTSGLSRRAALSGVAAASVYLWIPRLVKGYAPAEMRAMTVGERVEPGVSKWDLDTPALCVDLDKMEKNVATMQAALKKFGIPSRPHAK